MTLKAHQSPSGGLNDKGRAYYNRKNNSNLKAPTTSKTSGRRKSFCARMGGMKGPMKDKKGRPTRKAMSLKRWKC